MSEKSAQKVVHKYPLKHYSNPQTVELPYMAEILYFAIQDGKPMMWASHFVGHEQKMVTRYFRIIGTGREISEFAKHKGTCLDGAYVWHLFEVSQLPAFQ